MHIKGDRAREKGKVPKWGSPLSVSWWWFCPVVRFSFLSIGILLNIFLKITIIPYPIIYLVYSALLKYIVVAMQLYPGQSRVRWFSIPAIYKIISWTYASLVRLVGDDACVYTWPLQFGKCPPSHRGLLSAVDGAAARWVLGVSRVFAV